MAVPPETLNDDKTHGNAKQTLWTTIPLPVQREIVQAVTVMLSAALLPSGKEETHD